MSQLLFGVFRFVAIRTANGLGLGTGRAPARSGSTRDEFAGADARRSTAMQGPSDYLTAPFVCRAAARRPDLQDTRGSLSF